MRKLLTTLVVLVALAAVGDRLAEEVAEAQVASMVREREGLAATPDVEFAGFPFLTQLLSNEMQKVRLSLPEVEAPAGDEEGVRVEEVVATFFDVRTSHSLRRATADRMAGRALIPYESVSALGPFTASYAGSDSAGAGTIRLTPDEEVPDAGLDATLDVGVSVQDGTLRFTGGDGTTGTAAVPSNLRPVLGALLDADHRLYGLPSSFTVESLRVEESGIALRLSGRDVPLSR